MLIASTSEVLSGATANAFIEYPVAPLVKGVPIVLPKPADHTYIFVIGSDVDAPPKPLTIKKLESTGLPPSPNNAC